MRRNSLESILCASPILAGNRDGSDVMLEFPLTWPVRLAGERYMALKREMLMFELKAGWDLLICAVVLFTC